MWGISRQSLQHVNTRIWRAIVRRARIFEAQQSCIQYDNHTVEHLCSIATMCPGVANTQQCIHAPTFAVFLAMQVKTFSNSHAGWNYYIAVTEVARKYVLMCCCIAICRVHQHRHFLPYKLIPVLCVLQNISFAPR